jgi:hypothetical protein
MMDSIHDLVGQYIVERLKEACIDIIPEDDYRAVQIRQGLLQEDPVDLRLALLVNPGDPEDKATDPKWSDVLAGEEKALGIPSYEIGGGEWWLRRFCVDCRFYFINSNETRDEARKIAGYLFAASENALSNKPISGVTDDFGEHAIMIYVTKKMFYESGGPPNSFIWRGKLFVQVLTERQ